MATYTGLDGNPCTSFVVVGGGFDAGSCGFSQACLTLNSTNRMDFKIANIDVLGLDDADITALVAAADTAGSSLYMHTLGGGVASTGCAGQTGGLWQLQTGDGSDAGATSDANGGQGGLFLITTGDGGAGDGSCASCSNGGNSGTGGALCMSTAGGATGGAATGVNSNGGDGSTSGFLALVTKNAGNGGASTLAVGGCAGVGGDLLLRTGNGGLGGVGTGCNCGGNSGRGGDICIRSGAGGVAVECGCAGATGVVSIRPGNIVSFSAGRDACLNSTLGFFGATRVVQQSHVADITVGCQGSCYSQCTINSDLNALEGAINTILAQLAALGLQACA